MSRSDIEAVTSSPFDSEGTESVGNEGKESADNESEEDCNTVSSSESVTSAGCNHGTRCSEISGGSRVTR